MEVVDLSLAYRLTSLCAKAALYRAVCSDEPTITKLIDYEQAVCEAVTGLVTEALREADAFEKPVEMLLSAEGPKSARPT